MSHELPAMAEPSGVLELRQYTLHPGRRDELIELFERHFLDGQAACGMRVVGQFRDAGDPDRFVWLRGFRDMAARAEALAAFYDGPIWRAHRTAANATMIDSDDVLLLRPLEAGAGPRPTRGALFVATVYLLHEPATAGFARFFETEVRPLLTATGAPPISRMVTEYAENDYPRLPVRAGEHAFVWLAAFDDAGDYARHAALLRESAAWSERVEPVLRARLKSPPQLLRLKPTAHSRLGRGPGVGAVHDFDFLAGQWNVANRRLAARGVGSRDWIELPATSVMNLHLGGVANVEELCFSSQGWSGLTLRTFDPRTRQWSIYWVDSRSGTLSPPVVGGFDGDRGEFHGDDHDDGRPVEVRFYWTRLGPRAARWEQAFSYDHGQSWEPNWVMDFTRAP